MENRQNQPQDFSYLEALHIKETQLALKEAQIIIHLEKYGEQPKSGIPLFDAFIDVGCPCRECWRDEFL